MPERASHSRPTPWVALWLAVALVAALRWWTRARLFYNWDSVQYALATQQYALRLHRPHPPGSVFYVGLARWLNSLTGDPHAGLLAISAMASGLTVVALYALGREAGGKGTAAWAAALGTTAPLFWFYGSVGLNYAVDGLLATLAGLYALRAWKGQSDLATAALAGATLGLAGGVRPTTELFLAPVWLVGVANLGFGRGRLGAALLAVGAAALATLGWLIPSVLNAGGALAYWRLNHEMDHLLSSTAVWRVPDPVAALRYAGTTHRRCLESMLGAASLPLAASLVARAAGRRQNGPLPLVEAGEDAHTSPQGTLASPAEPGRADSEPPLTRWMDAAFWTLWIAPAAAFYLLVHFNSPGYSLVYAPALVVLAARVLAAWTDGWPRPTHAGLIGIVVLANAGLFWFGFPWATPRLGQRAISRAEIASHDGYWRALRAYLAQRYPPGSVRILASGTSTEGLRIVEALLPQYESDVCQVVDLNALHLPPSIRALSFLHFCGPADVLRDPRSVLAVWRTAEDRSYHRNTFRGLLPEIPIEAIGGGWEVGVVKRAGASRPLGEGGRMQEGQD